MKVNEEMSYTLKSGYERKGTDVTAKKWKEEELKGEWE